MDAPGLIDSHCHLTDPAFDPDREAVLARAREAGVGAFIVIGATGEFEHNVKAVELAGRHRDVFAVVGVHPHDVPGASDETYVRLRALAENERVVGLGETGLDFHYRHSPQETQRAHFRRHIHLAGELGLPLCLHVRDAYPEAIRLLAQEGVRGLRAVAHCFTGSRADAAGLLDMGLYLSFTGIVTFKNAHELRAVVRDAPLERMLVETDCPLLAPAPYRGRRNEPAFLRHVTDKIAEIKGTTPAEIARATGRNARELFALGP